MARRRRTGGDAGRHAIDFLEVLVVDAVDAQRAFLHHPDIVVIFARAVGAGPRAQLAADAHVLVDQHDAVLGALVGRAGRADRDAGRLGAMHAGFRGMHGPAGRSGRLGPAATGAFSTRTRRSYQAAWPVTGSALA